MTPYREAVLELALSYLTSGYTDNADEELLRALALDPGLELPEGASGAARAAFERVRAASAGVAGGALMVVAEPAGAEVSVDGRVIQTSPAVFEGLARGQHIVRVTADGHEAAGQLVTLGDEPLTVALALRAAAPGSVATDEARAPAADTSRAPTVPLGGDGGLGALVRAGSFGAPFEAVAGPVARDNDLAAIAMVVARPRSSGSGLVMAALVWVPGEGLAQVAETEVSEDLSGLQLAVLDLAELAASAALAFPTDRRVAVQPPIFALPSPPARATVAQAVAPEPEPEPELAAPPSTETVRKSPLPSAAAPSLFAPTPAVSRPRPERGGPERGWPERGWDEDAQASREDDAASPFYASWWFWTLTVGALAGGTTAAVLANSGNNGPRTWRATVTW